MGSLFSGASQLEGERDPAIEPRITGANRRPDWRSIYNIPRFREGVGGVSLLESFRTMDGG